MTRYSWCGRIHWGTDTVQWLVLKSENLTWSSFCLSHSCTFMLNFYFFGPKVLLWAKNLIHPNVDARPPPPPPQAKGGVIRDPYEQKFARKLLVRTTNSKFDRNRFIGFWDKISGQTKGQETTSLRVHFMYFVQRMHNKGNMYQNNKTLFFIRISFLNALSTNYKSIKLQQPVHLLSARSISKTTQQ
jgi:hypothetical protein